MENTGKQKIIPNNVNKKKEIHYEIDDQGVSQVVLAASRS